MEGYFSFLFYIELILGVNVTALSLHSYSRWIISTSNTSHFIPPSASLSNHFQLTRNIAIFVLTNTFLLAHPIMFWPFINFTGNKLTRTKTKQITRTFNVMWLAWVSFCFCIYDFLKALYDQKIRTEDCCSRFIFDKSPAVNIWFIPSTLILVFILN